MRRRALRTSLWAVTIAVLLVGVPMAIFGVTMIWNQGVAQISSKVSDLSSIVDRRINRGDDVTPSLLTGWGNPGEPLYIEVVLPGGEKVVSEEDPPRSYVSAEQRTVTGAVVEARMDRGHLYISIAGFLVLVGAATAIAHGVAALFAARQSRKVAAPLIYLAASAEQIGAGHVRPHMQKSGIEEIDLVAEELARTADRMAGRLAAERQFAADASHQLRTPLTALSMRLDEIEFLTDDDEVLTEVRACQDQVERLTGVVTDLLKTSRSDSGGTTEAVSLDRVFDQQAKEWTKVFAKAKRQLTFDAEEAMSVLATPGSVSQIVATLIENSLKYGDGHTVVEARPTANKKGVVINVSDEGPGVADDMASEIFKKHVSTGGSTGLGLALASDLAKADGGRLELTRRRPPVFSLTLNAVPKALDPNVVLPQGPLVMSSGRRRRR